MNNQQQGSRTPMVRQTAPVFPPLDTSVKPLTYEQTPTTTHFLEMGRAALCGEPVDVGRPKPPPSKHFQQTRRPVPVAPPSLLIPDQGEDQDAPATQAQTVERKARSKAHHRKPLKAVPPAPAAGTRAAHREGSRDPPVAAQRDSRERPTRVQQLRTHRRVGRTQPTGSSVSGEGARAGSAARATP